MPQARGNIQRGTSVRAPPAAGMKTESATFVLALPWRSTITKDEHRENNDQKGYDWTAFWDC